MSFIYYCPQCGQKLNVDDSLENTTASCPVCHTNILLARAAQAEDGAQGRKTQVLPKDTPPLPQPTQTPTVPQANINPVRQTHQSLFAALQAASAVPRSGMVSAVIAVFAIIAILNFLVCVFIGFSGDNSDIIFSSLAYCVGGFIVLLIPCAMMHLLDDIRRSNIAILKFLQDQHNSR